MPRCAVILIALFLNSSASWAGETKLPNIVVILADDMGIGDPGCYNKDSKIPTPNIDKFAKQGLRFTDAHSPSAVCSPTRYGILTGRYCWRSPLKKGVLQGYDPLLIEPGRLTMAAMLKAAGYHTACIGKWHLGFGTAKKVDYFKPLTPGPNSVGFDMYFGIPSSLDFEPYVYVDNEQSVEKPTLDIAASKHHRDGGAGFWRAGKVAPGFKHAEVLPTLTKKAVGYIEERAKQKAPFFLYFAMTGPHTPWLPTKQFQGQSKAGVYGDFVAQCDWTVGQVLEALERTGTADNTLVIVTSDNGAHWLPSDITQFGHRANLFFRGQKADIWEAGHRIPFIARWPGKTKQGGTSDETICLIDLFATAADIAGKKLPKNAGEDSYSIVPILKGQKLKGALREATVYHSGQGLFGIRQGDWVLVEGLGSGGFTKPQKVEPKPGEAKGQLYNLAKDLGQENNVWLQNPDVVARMHDLLEQYQKQGYSRPMKE